MNKFILRLFFHPHGALRVAYFAAMLTVCLCAPPAMADSVPTSVSFDYSCSSNLLFYDGAVPAGEWHSGASTVAVHAGIPCWLRIAHLPAAANALSFDAPWADVALFDAHGRELASAHGIGARSNALVSGGRIMIPVDQTAPAPLYARIDLIAGVPTPVSIDEVTLSAAIAAGQERDTINVAQVTALLLVALMTALFSMTLRDGNYAWYALFTFSIAVYSMGSESALFGWLWQYFDAPFFLFLMADIAIGVAGTVMVARSGNFARHNPGFYRFLMLLAMLYLPLLIPALLGRFELFNRLGAVMDTIWSPVVMTGLWRGWRQGERNCGLLFFGLIPNAIYWVPPQLQVALGVDLSWTQLPPPGGLLGMALILLLPALYCYTLVETSLVMRRANIRLKEETDRLTLQEVRLNAQREAAEAARRIKSTFLAAASHDLRQPMHALGLFLYSLQRTVLNARQRELVEHIEASANAAREMLDTLLDFSRLEAGAIIAYPGSFPLQATLRKLENEFAPQANAKNLLYRSRDTQCIAHADSGLVELILRNLISNAIRYTERGGILIACRNRAESVTVEVWDTGIGIPASQHQEIFREFYQVGNPERDRNKGLGLGLTIVDGLVRNMELQIAVSSTLGRGSVFRLTLPQGTVHDHAPAALPAAQLMHLTDRRVLVVEDNHAARLAMLELLAQWDCQYLVFESMEEAVEAAPAFAPELLITDYRLREYRTGQDVLQAVAARLGHPIPTIIVTGDTAPQRLRDAQASGAILLHKPVAPAALRTAMEALLT